MLEPWELQPNATVAWQLANSSELCAMLEVEELPRGWYRVRLRSGPPRLGPF